MYRVIITKIYGGEWKKGEIMRSKNWFWGIALILLAALVLTNEFNLFHLIFGFPRLLLTLLLSLIILNNLRPLNIYGIVFPAALIVWLYRSWVKSWGFNATFWSLMLSALLLSVGLSLLFDKKHRIGSYTSGHHKEQTTGDRKHASTSHEQASYDEQTNMGHNTSTSNEDVVRFNVSFATSSKYIVSDNLKKADVRCSFGSAKIFLNDAQLSSDGATLYMEVSFGNATIYIPKTLHTTINADVVLGNITEQNKVHETDGPILHICGHVTFSAVTIVYI